jgi:hypothetical protein
MPSKDAADGLEGRAIRAVALPLTVVKALPLGIALPLTVVKALPLVIFLP